MEVVVKHEQKQVETGSKRFRISVSDHHVVHLQSHVAVSSRYPKASRAVLAIYSFISLGAYLRLWPGNSRGRCSPPPMLEAVALMDAHRHRRCCAFLTGHNNFGTYFRASSVSCENADEVQSGVHKGPRRSVSLRNTIHRLVLLHASVSGPEMLCVPSHRAS